jgi:hypothetical protein
MNSLRPLTLLVLAIALLAPAAALADKAKPKSSVPKLLLTLTDGATNSKTVKPTIKLTFDPPKGTTTATACKGKVSVSVPIGKKTVKKKTVAVLAAKSAAIKSVAGVCTATPTLTLPAALLGKTLKFTAVFKGNDAVAKFKKSASLKVVVATPSPAPTPPAPPAPPVIHSGIWAANLSTGDPTPSWQFEIKPDGSVSGISQASTYPVTCAAGYHDTAGSFPLTTPFSFIGDTASVHFQASGSGVAGKHYNVGTDFAFNINASGTGTGTVTAGGTFITTDIGPETFQEAHCDFGPQTLTLTRLSG